VSDLDELLLEKEWRRCAPAWDTSTLDDKIEAFTYWCEHYVFIKHPQGRRIFDMRDAQRETVRIWLSDESSIVLKARQIGFSTLAAVLSLWLTMFYRDRYIIMLSRTERDAKNLLAKSKYAYRFLPDWMKVRGPVVTSNQEMMSMSNESNITSLPSTSPARGESAFLIIGDELAFMPNADEAYASIEPAVDVGGRLILLSTANGEGNLFHKLWTGCKGWGNGTNRYTGIFYDWRAGDRDDAWYAAKAAELPEWQMAQEYPDNPDDAFLKSGRPVFNLQKLRELELLPPTARGYLRRFPDQPIEFVEDGGVLRVWKLPNAGDRKKREPRHRYSMGVDVAEGLEHGDFSSIHVIDANTREVVAHWHGHIDPDLLGSDVVPLLGRWYNDALAIVEANNHGLTTLTALQRSRYSPIYRRKRLANRQKATTEVMGWATTAVSKPLAIDELAKELRDGGIALYDQETVAELRTFVREGDGKMHGSPHDDRVMSLAIAVQGLKYVFAREYNVVEKPGPGTFGHLMQRKDLWGDDEEDSSSFIGANAVA
jgi:hypothetical protein